MMCKPSHLACLATTLAASLPPCCHVAAMLRPAATCVADLQMVNITLRVLSKPNVDALPLIYKVRLAG